jgi:hypothetical protein
MHMDLEDFQKRSIDSFRFNEARNLGISNSRRTGKRDLSASIDPVFKGPL